MHARTEGLQRVTWWLLAVLDLDESLVGMTSEVFRLLFGVFFFCHIGEFSVSRNGKKVCSIKYMQNKSNKSIKAQLHNYT